MWSSRLPLVALDLPGLTNSGKELFLPPAFASSHSERERPWRGISLPQSRCRDGRRSHDRTTMGALRMIQTHGCRFFCSVESGEWVEYPMLERLVKAATAPSDRPNVRRSPPRSPRSDTAEMQDGDQSAPQVPQVENARSNDARSERSLDSLSTVQSFEIPDEGSEEEQERSTASWWRVNTELPNCATPGMLLKNDLEDDFMLRKNMFKVHIKFQGCVLDYLKHDGVFEDGAMFYSANHLFLITSLIWTLH
eukprot:s1138_g4.t1